MAWLCRHNGLIDPLQLGRGRKPRIGSRNSRINPGNSFCFNWAAVGNRGSVRSVGLGFTCQKSFNWAAVGNLGSAQLPAYRISGETVASIGPRSETADRRRGWRYPAFPRCFNWAAVGNRGSATATATVCSRPSGFNWAAVGNRGSEAEIAFAVFSCSLLQLGRGRKPRIGA